MKRYAEEVVPSERRGADTDELRTLAPTDATTSTGTGVLDVPERQQGGGSLAYHRAPFGAGLTTAPQDVDLGIEVKQAGAGRAFVRPSLTFPEQSVTPEPDRRRIARPMPSMARDAVEVIRPPGGGG